MIATTASQWICYRDLPRSRNHLRLVGYWQSIWFSRILFFDFITLDRVPSDCSASIVSFFVDPFPFSWTLHVCELWRAFCESLTCPTRRNYQLASTFSFVAVSSRLQRSDFGLLSIWIRFEFYLSSPVFVPLGSLFRALVTHSTRFEIRKSNAQPSATAVSITRSKSEARISKRSTLSVPERFGLDKNEF